MHLPNVCRCDLCFHDHEVEAQCFVWCMHWASLWLILEVIWVERLSSVKNPYCEYWDSTDLLTYYWKGIVKIHDWNSCKQTSRTSFVTRLVTLPNWGYGFTTNLYSTYLLAVTSWQSWRSSLSKQHHIWFCHKIGDGPQFMTLLTRNVQNCFSNAGEHHQLSRGILRFVPTVGYSWMVH